MDLLSFQVIVNAVIADGGFPADEEIVLGIITTEAELCESGEDEC